MKQSNFLYSSRLANRLIYERLECRFVNVVEGSKGNVPYLFPVACQNPSGIVKLGALKKI